MKNYASKEEKTKDIRSTGFTFCFVGILGILFLVLLNFNILPIQLVNSSKILVTVVMGIVFIIFFIIGIMSFRSLKKVASEAEYLENKINKIVNDIIDHYADELRLIGDEENLQDQYFTRVQKINALINQKYKLDDNDLDYITEEIYHKIYES